MPNDNKYMNQYMKSRYIKLKLQAIEYKGGKCSKCGYDKCHGALEFHHRDPNEKDFNWHQLRKQSIKLRLLELDKCDLVCANCHREVHHDHTLTKLRMKFITEKNASRKINEKLCLFCNEKFKPKESKIKYCSTECFTASRVKINWPHDLPELVEKSSKRAIAKQLGVSDKAVAKRLKNHHLMISDAQGYVRSSLKS